LESTYLQHWKATICSIGKKKIAALESTYLQHWKVTICVYQPSIEEINFENYNRNSTRTSAG
jgi:hypothetical protein